MPRAGAGPATGKELDDLTDETADGGIDRRLRIAALGVLAGAATGVLAVLIARSQMSRFRRDLFSRSVLRRCAALGYIAREPASIEGIMLIRDFISWERRGLLRGRARAILARMEAEARAGLLVAAERAG